MAFWHIFQRSANKIQSWKLPPDVKEFLQKLSDALPEKLVNGFTGYVGRLYKKEGKEVTGAFISNLMDSLKNILK